MNKKATYFGYTIFFFFFGNFILQKTSCEKCVFVYRTTFFIKMWAALIRQFDVSFLECIWSRKNNEINNEL